MLPMLPMLPGYIRVEMEGIQKRRMRGDHGPSWG